jgi:DNA-directed RNA polymerase subunit H (RpoH/RPB5)
MFRAIEHLTFNEVVASPNLVRPVMIEIWCKKMPGEFDVTKHALVPKHAILSEAEKKKITQKYRLIGQEFPRILKTDPAIANLKPKEGDVIKIVRSSQTSGKAVFYRRVVSV